MNDITALAQRMKQRAKSAKEFGEQSLYVEANNVLALVEALEKAQHNAAVDWEAAASMNVENQELKQRISELESRTVTVKLSADSDDSEVGSRNQPGMVVAVHIDAGDFVKFKGQVFEVEETDFDDHDVMLWFVGGDVLRCAAGCQIEVVAAPAAAGINVEAE